MTKPRTSLSEAPVVFAKRFAACEPSVAGWEMMAWHAKFGDFVARIADRGSCGWSCSFSRRGEFFLIEEASTKAGAVQKLQTFLKALKRAVEGVP